MNGEQRATRAPRTSIPQDGAVLPCVTNAMLSREHGRSWAELRRKAACDPWRGGSPGWRGRRGCACADGSRASWRGDGCWAGRCACSRRTPLGKGERSRAAVVLMVRVVAPPARDGLQALRTFGIPLLQHQQWRPTGPAHRRKYLGTARIEAVDHRHRGADNRHPAYACGANRVKTSEPPLHTQQRAHANNTSVIHTSLHKSSRHAVSLARKRHSPHLAPHRPTSPTTHRAQAVDNSVDMGPTMGRRQARLVAITASSTNDRPAATPAAPGGAT